MWLTGLKAPANKLTNLSLEALVEGPGGVVAGPVLQVTVGVREEVAGQHGEVGVLGGELLSQLLLARQLEVVLERAELDVDLPVLATVHVLHQPAVVAVLLVPLHLPFIPARRMGEREGGAGIGGGG